MAGNIAEPAESMQPGASEGGDPSRRRRRRGRRGGRRRRRGGGPNGERSFEQSSSEHTEEDPGAEALPASVGLPMEEPDRIEVSVERTTYDEALPKAQPRIEPEPPAEAEPATPTEQAPAPEAPAGPRKRGWWQRVLS